MSVAFFTIFASFRLKIDQQATNRHLLPRFNQFFSACSIKEIKKINPKLNSKFSKPSIDKSYIKAQITSEQLNTKLVNTTKRNIISWRKLVVALFGFELKAAGLSLKHSSHVLLH